MNPETMLHIRSGLSDAWLFTMFRLNITEKQEPFKQIKTEARVQSLAYVG